MEDMNRSTARERLRIISFTALRVTAGVILIAHGWQKLTDLHGWQDQLANMGVAGANVLAYFAIAGEFLGGFGLLFGLLTPVAAFGAACSMAAAIVLVHAGNGLFAKNGGFEYPLVLLMTCLLFVAHGGGAWSIDAGLQRARAGSKRPRTLERDGASAWEEAHAASRR